MQHFTSKNTSINSNKLPSTFTKYKCWKGKNLDVGGGKFDNASEYLLKEYGCINLVYDKYNRSYEYNKKVLLDARHGVDTITCNNVLNVIDDDEAMEDVIRLCMIMASDKADVYIKIYEGDKSGNGRQTGEDQWQKNLKTEKYFPFIIKYFSHIERHGDIIICNNK